MRFTLQSGRKVGLESLHILPTRFDGTAASQREYLSSVLSGIVRQFYPDGEVPVAVIWPAGESIPQTTCIASFTSEPLGLPAGEGFSYLVVCWFVHYVERSVANIVCEGLSRLDWKENACDYPWW